MNLLFVIPYTPSLIRTRPYNLLRALTRRGHAITLATLWETPPERQVLAELAQQGLDVLSERLSRTQITRNALRGLWGPAPLQARYCWHPRLAQAIAHRLGAAARPFDAVHVEHLRGAEYGRQAARTLRPLGRSTPVIWDSVDCISLLFEQAARHSRSRFGRWVTRFELPRTRRYEGACVRFFSGVLATSHKDCLALAQLAAKEVGAPTGVPGSVTERVQVLPNGVDLEYFAPGPGPGAASTIIFSGKMSYHANVTAALHLVSDIMPSVWRRCPQASVVIAGSRPPREVWALAERYAPRVSVTGFVPDLRPYLRGAALAVAPVAYGAGIQNKVLEAMACQLPVVASRQACSALDVQPGRDLLAADTADDFAAAIVQLLEAPGLRAQIGQAGRQYVCQRHDWDEIARQLEQFYLQAQGRAAQLAALERPGDNS